MVLSFLLVFPALGAETIKIGALYNLTGGMSSIDAPALNGAKLQAKLINEKGGLLGKELEVIGIDTKTDQKAAATGAKKALANGVVAGIGYGDTTFVMAAAPLFQQKGVPFVTSGATHPMLPKWVGDYMFMTPFGDDDQSFAIADYSVNKLGAKNVVVWTDNSMDFTKALSKFYKQRFKELGGNVVLEDFFMMGDKDFSAQIARLKNASPKADAVFISAIPNEAGLTVKQIREAGLDLPIVSGDGFDTELVTSVPGDKLANEVYFSTHTYREDNRPEVVAFVAAYEKEYGRPPENAFATLGFDAVGLIADAIQRAGTTDGKALRAALAGTQGFKAVTGEITYSRPSGVPMKGVSIISVHDGKYKVEEVWFPKQ
jgi:branched-chain amino acid transport system substrate-binding protein